LRTTKSARSIRLDPSHYERLELMATERGTHVAALIRLAVSQFLNGANTLSQSELRDLRVAEYSQIALDIIIRENHPDRRDAMVEETDRRMARYHGA
jgi:predicted DNA-binding protein